MTAMEEIGRREMAEAKAWLRANVNQRRELGLPAPEQEAMANFTEGLKAAMSELVKRLTPAIEAILNNEPLLRLAIREAEARGDHKAAAAVRKQLTSVAAKSRSQAYVDRIDEAN